MRPEQKLKFRKEKEFVIETLGRQIQIALTPLHDGKIQILSITVKRTNNSEEIRVTTRYSVNGNIHAEEESRGQTQTDNRTVKAGEVFLQGRMLSPEYFAVLARIAE